MGPGKPSSPVTTLLDHTPFFEVVCWRENEVAQDDGRAGYAGSQDFILGAGDQFRFSWASQMVVVHEIPGVARTMCWSGSSPAGCISI
jgi:hypothetical protein